MRSNVRGAEFLKNIDERETLVRGSREEVRNDVGKDNQPLYE